MKRLLLTAVLCAAAITAHAQTRDHNNPDPNKGEMFHYASVGAWNIWIDPTVGLGCEAIVEGNSSGVRLRFGVDPGSLPAPLFMEVEHPNWTSIVDGQEYRHTVQIDGYAAQTITGVGLHTHAGVPAVMFRYLSPAFLTMFRQGAWIRLWYETKVIIAISLQDSNAALHKVADCQREVAKFATDQSAPSSASPY